MAKQRKAISKRVRFEVFKRDSFTCQYCGRKSPEVILHVDHIEPVSKGGDNGIINLITSCEPCNLGKSDVPLSATDRIDKEMSQLQELQERREQMKMLADWRKGLRSLQNEELDILAEEWGQAFGWVPEEAHRKQIKLLCSRSGFQMAVDVIAKAGESYADIDDDVLFKRIRGIEKAFKLDAECPGKGKIPYIIGIMRNKSGSKMWLSNISNMLNALFESDEFSIDLAVTAAKNTRSISDYHELLQDACSKLLGREVG